VIAAYSQHSVAEFMHALKAAVEMNVCV